MARSRTRLVTESYVPTPTPPVKQLPGLIRLIWFCVFGWWMGGALMALTIILAPFVGIFAWGTIGDMWRASMTLMTLEQR